MNTDKELIYRLLRLIPVSELKDLVIDSKGKNQVDLIKELQISKTLDEIKSEIIKQYGYLKQHIYVFGLEKKVKKEKIKLLLNDHFKEIGNKFYFFQKCNFKVKAIYEGSKQSKRVQKLEAIDVEFLQPCMVKLEGDHLIVCFTILEKSISSYLPDYRIFETVSEIKEEDIIKQIELNLSGFVIREDLNKGIKYLWEKDIIDSKYVTFKKTSSTSREIMDEELTFKETYPIDYKEVLKAPLQKTTFRIISNQNSLCDFVSNPSDGIVSFNKFPENQNQVENVISEIIRNNR